MKSIIITLSIVVVAIIIGLTAFYFFQTDLKDIKISQPLNANGAVSTSSADNTSSITSTSTRDDLNLINATKNTGTFKIFSIMIRYAGLETMLKDQGPYTILAPTDSSFGKLDKSTSQKLLSDKQYLADMIKNHIIDGAYTYSELKQRESIQSISGNKLIINSKNTTTTINGANIISQDIMATNGIIQGIDSVLLNK